MKNSSVFIIAVVAAVAMVAGLTVQIVISQPMVAQSSTAGSFYSTPGSGMAGPGMMGSGVGGGMMMGGTPGMGRMMGGPSMMGPQTYGNYSPQGMTGSMPMMGMMGYNSRGSSPLPHDAAKTLVNGYLASLNNPDLAVDEFEEYSHNFYVAVVERSTGRGAFELIIDRYNGNVQLEPQSMMWNFKYGMSGMMSGSFGASASGPEATVTSEEALRIAQDFLNVAYPGTVADEILPHPGYYTIMTTLNGEHYGMLSVNSYSGDVWYHTWHGMFIDEVD